MSGPTKVQMASLQAERHSFCSIQGGGDDAPTARIVLVPVFRIKFMSAHHLSEAYPFNLSCGALIPKVPNPLHQRAAIDQVWSKIV